MKEVMRRGVILFTAVCCFVGGTQAQLSVVDAPDTVAVFLDQLGQSGLVAAYWGVQNNGDQPQNLMVSRSLVDTVSPFNYPFTFGAPGSSERFCWGPQCYNFGSDNSSIQESFLVVLEPGEVDSSFVADFYPNGIVGNTTMEYCFHEVDNNAAEVCHRVTFVVKASVGVEEIAENEPSLVRISPNPATSSATIKVQNAQGGLIQFRNLVGQTVKSVPIFAGVSEQLLSLDDLPKGIWLVSYAVDGTTVSTKRLVIR